MKRILAWSAAGLLAATVLTAGGLALASPGDAETLDVCYHTRSGALRVDVSGSGCGRAESPATLGGGKLVTRIVTAERTLPADGFGGLTAECGEGEVVLGGGFEVASINPDTAIVTNAPLTLTDGRQGWHVTLSAGGPVQMWTFAVCAPGVAAG